MLSNKIMLLSYVIGALISIVGVCMIPTKPSITSQPNETLQETSARIDAEYTDTVLKSNAFKVCLAGVAGISVGILLQISKCCTEVDEESDNIRIQPEKKNVSRVPKIYLHPYRTPTPPKIVSQDPIPPKIVSQDPTPPKKILSEIGVNPLQAKPYSSFAHYPPKWRPQG